MGVNKIIMADPGGFEPPTPWFEVKYSIQLSYGSAMFGLKCCLTKCKKISGQIRYWEPDNYKKSNRNFNLAEKIYAMEIFKNIFKIIFVWFFL